MEIDIDFVDEEIEFDHLRCAEIFYETKEHKLVCKCLFCNVEYYQKQFTEFAQHLFEHFDVKDPGTEKPIPKQIENFEIEFVEPEINDSGSLEIIDNSTEKPEPRSIISSIKSFSSYEINTNNNNEPNGKFKCPYCEAYYLRRSNLYIHLEKKHDFVTSFEVEADVFGKYPCPECDMEFFNKGSFISHVRRKHEDYFYNTIDKQQNKNDLKLQKFEKNEFEFLVCEEEKELQIEDIQFSEQINEEISKFNIESVNNNDDIYNLGLFNKNKKHNCPCCQYTNSTRYGIYSHLEYQHGISTILKIDKNSNNKYECTQCSLIFDVKGNLAYHLRQKHEEHYYDLLAKQQVNENYYYDLLAKQQLQKKDYIFAKSNQNLSDESEIDKLETKIQNSLPVLQNKISIDKETPKKQKLYSCLKEQKKDYIFAKSNQNLSDESEIDKVITKIQNNLPVLQNKISIDKETPKKQKLYSCLKEQKKDYIFPKSNQNLSDESEIDKVETKIQNNITELQNKISIDKETPKKQKLYSCLKEQCDFSTINMKVFRDHNNKQHAEVTEMNFQCPICSLSYASSAGVDRHLYIKHNIASTLIIEPDLDGMFQCPKCSLITNRKKSFSLHLKKKHKEYYLELLSQQQSINDLQKSNNLNVCEICGKQLPSTGSLKQHIRHHNNPKIECSECGKMLSSKSSLTKHLKIHLNIRDYICRYCDRAFVKKEVRNYHEMRIHTNQRNYQCDECGKQFVTTNLLKNHLRRHNNEKPEECNECHKTFYDKKSLRMHALIHSGVKKYECETCGRRFTRSLHLKTHRAIHDGFKHYKCIICDKSFAQNAGLYSHMKTKHRDLKDKSSVE